MIKIKLLKCPRSLDTFRQGEQEVEKQVITKPILHKNYPNPFNPTTTISFSLPEEENVEIVIFNIKGQQVKTLYKGMAEEGEHKMIWNGKDTNNKLVSSGFYFYKLKTNVRNHRVVYKNDVLNIMM